MNKTEFTYHGLDYPVEVLEDGAPVHVDRVSRKGRDHFTVETDHPDKIQFRVVVVPKTLPQEVVDERRGYLFW